MSNCQENPLVSFLVPCYNYGKYLKECLQSIFNQEEVNDFEIIAIDDASTDATKEILSSIQDSRLRTVYHTVNQGHLVTVNEAFQLARGKFIARIDPDDRYRTYFLKVTLEKFKEFPNIGMVYGDAALIDAEGEITQSFTDRVHQSKDFYGNEFRLLLKENFICAPTTIARREAWKVAMPLPKGLAFNDWYLNLKMAEKWDFYYRQEVLADYRVHGENHHSKIVMDRTEESSIRWLVEMFFSTSEKCKEILLQESRFQKEVLATQLLRLGDKYFGFEMNQDARRCYWEVFQTDSKFVFSKAGVRFLATFFHRKIYNQAKAFLFKK